MSGDDRGQITVFLALMFLVFCGAAFCILEGMRAYLGSALCEEAVLAAGNEILANYDKTVYQRYHLFFMDPREREYILSDAQAYLDSYYDESSFYGFRCGNLKITEEETSVEEGGLYLKHQIGEWMKYREIEKAGAELKKLFESTEQTSRTSGEEKQSFIQEGDTPSAEESSGEENVEGTSGDGTAEGEGQHVKEKLNWKQLKETLDTIVKSGVLYYAADDAGKISSASISKSGLPSADKGLSTRDSGDFKISFTKLQDWKKLLESGTFDDLNISSITEDIFVLDYIFRCFDCYTVQIPEDKSGKQALQYEVEYMIGLKDSDMKNLRYVTNQILLLRFLVNYAYAQNSRQIQTSASVLATALTGFLGFPEAQGAVQVLLTAALSYGESLLELHTLLAGGEISAVKSAGTWNLTFENAMTLLREKSMVKTAKWNVNYTDYLKLLLAFHMKKSDFYYRMMDVMQLNVALEEPGFTWKESLFSFRWSGTFQCPSWFTSIPVMGISNKNGFRFTLDKVVSY